MLSGKILGFDAHFGFAGNCWISATEIVDGYGGALSVTQGDSIEFYLSSDTVTSNVELPIYDILGEVSDVIHTDLFPQTVLHDSPWENGFGYAKSFSYTVPPELPSGVYSLGQRISTDATLDYSDELPFIVKSSRTNVPIVFLHPTNTSNAYNEAGGNSAYTLLADKRLRTVSFLRPQIINNRSRPLLRWIGQQGYDAHHIVDSDMEDFEEIVGSQVLVVIGHNEYWSEQARRNFDQFVAGGGNALILSGNTMYRRVVYDQPDNPTAFSVGPLDGEGPYAEYWAPNGTYPTQASIHVDYPHGGRSNIRSHGFTIANNDVPYLAGTALQIGDFISNPTSEYDGIPIAGFDQDSGRPIPDPDYVKQFHDFRFIGFDLVDGQNGSGTGAWIEFQESPTSGRVIVVGSTDWGNYGMLSKDASLVKQITGNMIEYLLQDFSISGDFDNNGFVDAVDIDILSRSVRRGLFDTAMDLNDDESIDDSDRQIWVEDIANTWFGDANLDDYFNSDDLIQVMKSHQYEDQLSNNSGWSEGDWNGDGEFDSADLAYAFQHAGFESGRRVSNRIVDVPSPGGATNMLIAAGLLCRSRFLRILSVGG